MSEVTTLEGDLTYTEGRFAVVVARFNGFIVDSLQAGALDAFRRHGVPDENVTVIKVPGAYEMPVAVQRVAQTGNYDAIIGLGAVIRGSTPHFDYVAGEASKGMASVAPAPRLVTRVPKPRLLRLKWLTCFARSID